MAADRIDLKHRKVTVDQRLQHIGGQLVITTPKAEKTRTIMMPAAVALEIRLSAVTGTSRFLVTDFRDD